VDRGERLLTECIEIKVLGILHASSEAKEGSISSLTGNRRRLSLRSRGAFLRVDDLASHNEQAAQYNKHESDIPHQMFLLCEQAATRSRGTRVPLERSCCHLSMT
jgi:hypothetical protein